MLSLVGEADSAPRSVLRVQAIDRWATERDGATIALGPNDAPVLHALVLSPSEGISRSELRRVLNQAHHESAQADSALRNALWKLKGKKKKDGLKIAGSDPLVLVRPQPRLEVDLWDFMNLVKEKLYDKAAELLAGRDELALPQAAEVDPGPWQEAIDEFAKARALVERETGAAATRAEIMLRTRADLLSKRLVPGFEPSASIHTLLERLEPMPLAWRLARWPETAQSPLPPVGNYIADTLLSSTDSPSQIMVAGPPGSGKALTAIATYVRLTDCFVNKGENDHGRTVLYLDGRRGVTNPAFGTDGWLDERLAAAGAQSTALPVVVMVHADAFLTANEERLDTVLNSRLFSDTDLLLCCNEQFYVKTLAYQAYGTHEIRLEDWGPELQSEYVRALYDEDACDRFEKWRDVYDSRAVICRSPLHLHYVAYLIATSDAELQTIERRWQLFSRIAAARMRSTSSKKMKAALMDDLGSIAHRFFRVARRPISFNEQDLLEDLQRREIQDPEKRVSALVEHTVLDSPTGGDELRFEDLLWGWFFVAHHLYRTVTNQELGPEDLLRAFEKLFPPAIMGRCEEMLRDWPERHEILDPLRRALEHASSRTVLRGRRRLAREQVGYLLGVLADAELQTELEVAVDLHSGPLEVDELVRRGIVIGLSSKGAAGVADSYVEWLRAELAGDGPTPGADLNVAFVLGFRGDRNFDPEKSHDWGSGPDPARTVFGLIRALENERHFGTWRIKIFTLLDLALRVTPDRFAERVLEHRQRLLATLDRLAADPATESWPEIAEMRPILNDERREERRRDKSGVYQGPERRSGEDQRAPARSI
jgi:hypothetical protein